MKIRLCLLFRCSQFNTEWMNSLWNGHRKNLMLENWRFVGRFFHLSPDCCLLCWRNSVDRDTAWKRARARRVLIADSTGQRTSVIDSFCWRSAHNSRSFRHKNTDENYFFSIEQCTSCRPNSCRKLHQLRLDSKLPFSTCDRGAKCARTSPRNHRLFREFPTFVLKFTFCTENNNLSPRGSILTTNMIFAAKLL